MELFKTKLYLCKNIDTKQFKTRDLILTYQLEIIMNLTNNQESILYKI